MCKLRPVGRNTSCHLSSEGSSKLSRSQASETVVGLSDVKSSESRTIFTVKKNLTAEQHTTLVASVRAIDRGASEAGL